MGDSRARPWPQRARTVQEDWLAWLPSEKGEVFDGTIGELETYYAMLSVTLDEALALCNCGTIVPAREQARVSADLFDRLAERLVAVLRALHQHGRHFGTLPNVHPLRPDFFRGETAQRYARKNNLLSLVLFPTRTKFFHKLGVLSEALEDLRGEYREAAEEIAEGAAVEPELCWQTLEMLHYDLNTCLREIMVMLKSFLCALPSEELGALRKKLHALPAPPAALHRRRTAIFRRE